MKEKTVCFECGVVLTGGNSYTLDGNTMCEECFERLTTNCDNWIDVNKVDRKKRKIIHS